ncbi:hypothetical protein AB0B50_42300 [Streptomyces sp. NPDC041068]|uniref:hypothetical protein n=1 Tax=Streptomyces sp. NPDC041068 TaxID=3155130 RepID=UPI0033DE1AAE
MQKTSQRIAAVGATAAAIFIATSTVNAHAIGSGGHAGCAVNGVDGRGFFKNWTHNSAKISLVTYDTQQDHRHVAIRLISKKDYDGKIRYWAWHHNRKGYNKKDVVETSASTGKSGLSYIGIQAAVMDGTRVVKSCKAWGQGT